MSVREGRQPILSNAVALGSPGWGGSFRDICWSARCDSQPKELGGLPRKQQEMTGKNSAEFPNMAQRAVMQYLSLDDWKIAARLPIPASERMLSRIRNYGWIEVRGEKHHTAIKLTPAGLEAMRFGHLKTSAGL